MSIEHDLNAELEKDFPPTTLNRPLRVNHTPRPDAGMATSATQPPVQRVSPPDRSSVALQMARPLVRLAEALDRIDQLAAAIEKAEAEAAKLLSVVKGKL